MRRERINILFGGLAGFISVAFLQLLSIDIENIDIDLKLATIIFSFALPLSIFYILSANEHLEIKKTNVPRWYDALAVITIVSGFIGITFLFHHFGNIQAISFVVVSLFLLFLFNKIEANKDAYFKPIEDTKKKKTEKKGNKRK
jgi:uncharacterized membrane protein YfcA